MLPTFQTKDFHFLSLYIFESTNKIKSNQLQNRQKTTITSFAVKKRENVNI